jgi:NhaA family Na+:H+ antiporter
MLLIAVAILAMLWANSPYQAAYTEFFDGQLSWTPIAKLATINLWIDDALMAIFFFVVGLEIKREVIDGELSDPQKRRLPIIAAIAGMAIPAIVFLGVAGFDDPLGRGWAIPAATDIAFALGVLALLGKGLPPSLRLFLLSVAIVDDLGAVAIIALFYTAKIKMAWLIAAAVILVVMMVLNRMNYYSVLAFSLLGIVLWFCVLHSGVHATIAGVLAAFTIPMKLGRKRHDCMLLRLEHALAPWNGYVIVPLFGLANAGVNLAGSGFSAVLQPLPLAIAAGLAVGKQVGIFTAITLSERTGFAMRPEGASWMQVWGVSALCGIGFTMSLFIAALAFVGQPDLYEQAKIGILAGSLLSVIIGFTVLRLSRSAAAATPRAVS